MTGSWERGSNGRLGGGGSAGSGCSLMMLGGSGGTWRRGVYRLIEVGQGGGVRARSLNRGRPLLGDGEGRSINLDSLARLGCEMRVATLDLPKTGKGADRVGF